VVIEVIPNGVDLSQYDGDFGAALPDALIYPGSVTYSANYDAVQYLVRDIYPLIKHSRPRTVLRITGKTNGVRIDGLAAAGGVHFDGYVPDIRPRIAQSWACVVPLRVGGGTRLKILESMALGTPVVSTSKGAEGLEVTPGLDILIGDTPASFAKHVVDLLEDRHLRDRISANGQRLVREKYNWEIIGQRLEALIADTVAGRRQ
jgi:glycosyltransferase involved in cell wall biosynthesis